MMEYFFGFFHSSRELKQEDSLSPTLFIITVEVSDRNLNRLNEDNEFIGIGLSKQSEKKNHLSYVDDTILIFLGHKGSVKKMMKNLQRNEKSFWSVNQPFKEFYLFA